MNSRAETLFREIQENEGDLDAWLKSRIDEGWQEDEFLEFKSGEIVKAGVSTKQKFKQLREALCETFSAFANTEGGVLIIGVYANDDKTKEDKRDVVQKLDLLEDCVETAEYIRKAKFDFIRPQLGGIEIIPYVMDSDGKKGIVVVLVPNGQHKPYQGMFHGAYYLRSLDSCYVMHHEVLKAMFYPKLSPAYDLELQIKRSKKELSSIGIYAHLTNIGNATAENVVVRMEVAPHCHIGTFSEKDLVRHAARYPDLSDQYSADIMELENIHPGQLAVKSVACMFSQQMLIHSRSGHEIYTKPLEEQLRDGARIVLKIYSRNNSPVIYDTNYTLEELLRIEGQTLQPIKS